MRVICLASLVAIVGCAHQPQPSESAQPPQTSASPVPALPTEPTVAASPPQSAAEMPSAPVATASTPKQPRLACAPIKVHFALDSDKLYDSEKPLLNNLARCLKGNDAQRVTIVGNADERGSEAYNMDLGQRRANRVASYLEQKGAARSQVEAVVSHGKDSPICPDSTLKCWQLNRRTAVRQTCHL
jgi:peptidoglycan-associated lipoprotein